MNNATKNIKFNHAAAQRHLLSVRRGGRGVRRLVAFLLLLFLCTHLHSQDLNLTQFYELPLLRNPALAGVFTGDIRVQTVYRNQWQSVTVPYRTSGLSTEVKFPVNDYGHYFTAGLQLTNDIAGDSKLTRTQILPVLSYHLPLANEDSYLSGAIMGGIVNSQFNPTGLRWDDQFVNGQYNAANPTRQVLDVTGKNYWDIGGGISFSSPLTQDVDYYVGIGLFHANTPRVAFEGANIRLGMKWAFNGGITFQTNDYSRLTIYGDYFLQKAKPTGAPIVKTGMYNVAILGGFYTYDLVQYDEDDKISLTLGGVYRYTDAIAPVVRLDMKHLSAGLSYDINISKLTAFSNARGGFELTLGFKNIFQSRVINAYRMRCVGF